MTKFVKTILGLGVVAAIAAAYASYLLFSSPFQNKESALIYLDRDDTMDSLYQKVTAEGKPSSLTGLKFMSALKRFTQPRTGCYTIEPGESSFDFIRRVANGSQTPIKLNVPEVRTIETLVERLAPQLMISADEITAKLSDSLFVDSLGYTKETLPCLFLPNTYEIYWNISAEKLLARFNKEVKSFWNEERIAKAKAMNMTPEQVVTLASIVEGETSYGPEKPTVAGLYLHRLEVGMPLQSDPTVIFAIGDFTIRRVTIEQTRYQSPYNTYVNQGLPPGPIRLASVQGIDAVLNYDHNNYLYMCAKEDFSGSHNFTESYAEHLQNAHRYQDALNKRGIKR